MQDKKPLIETCRILMLNMKDCDITVKEKMKVLGIIFDAQNDY